VDNLADIEAVKQLKARYFRYMDTRQWSAWRQVFTDDVKVTVESTVTRLPSDGVAEPMGDGADAFVKLIGEGLLAGVTTVHHGHMPEITLTGADTATGIWSMEDIVEYPDGRILRGYGHYHEQYRKVGGAWRIAVLHLTRLRLDYIGPWPKA
jgi:hypothetical protein